MHISLPVRNLIPCLVAGFALGLMLPGCGENYSEPKSIIPEVSPKDKAKESMEYFTKQHLQKKVRSKRG